MFINQCMGPDPTGGEGEPCYVPNNPLFGVPLDLPQDPGSPGLCSSACGACLTCQGAPGGSALDYGDCGSCLDHNGLGIGSSGSCNASNYWADDMGSFPGLPPLELDPLPSLFPFSPCQNSYKAERPTHDVADVLLSLKHAVLRPDGSPDMQGCSMSLPQHSGQNPHVVSHPGGQYMGPQASLSYTVHPQMLVSPASGGPNSYSSGYYDPQCAPCQGPMPLQHCTTAVFPSMSVNVSMNMTMHGYPDSNGQSCSQMQWGAQSSPPSVNVLYPPLLSPSPYGGGATYSFTADFRPPNTNLDPTKSAQQNQRHYLNNNAFQNQQLSKTQAYSPCIVKQARVDKLNMMGVSEEEEGGEEAESRPNLCRLCGKTYARPSTLKTHLRTHSGERPYRCPDCNKSFSQAANLTAHVRTHTGQKPFRCPICDRRFSQSSSVTTHMRTHSGERPYRCRACKKAFSDSSTLTKHLRIHSGEKPYQCKLCLLRFSQSGNLNRHMRVHGNNAAILS